MKLLVVGASGYVGRHVCRRALALGVEVIGTYYTKPLDIVGVDWRRLDVTDPAAVTALIGEIEPDTVVSSAYAGAPTLAPIAAGLNWRTNALGAVHVATAAAAVGARLVHVSSDAVHSGSPEPLTESDPPNPVYPYGAAKAAAELGVSLVAPDVAIVRISLINSDGTDDGGTELSNRERFMIDLAAGRTAGVLFTDDFRCPIAVTDVAAALIELALGVAGGGTEAAATFAGILNLAGPDLVSYYELGVLVARRHGLDPGALPVATSAGMARPGQVRLDTTLATSLLRTRLRGIYEILD